ncbi:hypothetical protein ISREJYDI_CDS0060 [Pseudomonas phage UNO-G1W1]|uniref:Uncharacterized protein n=1 Tax=Pseudomonas phage UNO-G1W1 TaxID=3136609 RepID=A0AAX4MW34_9CAUD
MTEEAHVNLTEDEIFAELVKLFTVQLSTADAIKDLKNRNKFNKKKNPTGIDSHELGLIVAAAKLEANENYEEFTGRNAEIQAKFEELTGYNA